VDGRRAQSHGGGRSRTSDDLSATNAVHPKTSLHTMTEAR
jgi:hypothetical protein